MTPAAARRGSTGERRPNRANRPANEVIEEES
jgi:hypothetical protein